MTQLFYIKVFNRFAKLVTLSGYFHIERFEIVIIITGWGMCIVRLSVVHFHNSCLSQSSSPGSGKAQDWELGIQNIVNRSSVGAIR